MEPEGLLVVEFAEDLEEERGENFAEGVLVGRQLFRVVLDQSALKAENSFRKRNFAQKTPKLKKTQKTEKMRKFKKKQKFKKSKNCKKL